MNSIETFLNTISRNDLLREKARLLDRMETLEAMASRCGGMSLVINEEHGKKRYYLSSASSPGAARSRRYLRSDENDLLQALLGKRYAESVLPVLRRDLRVVDYALRHGSFTTEESIMDSFRESGLPMDSMLYSTRKEYVSSWKTASYEKKANHPEDCIHLTLAGEYVRSKSEAMIASELFSSGIPYRYEAALHLKGVAYPLHPDFTLLHPDTLKITYWEHLGKMDDAEYADSQAKRIQLYSNYGILSGRNLILTLETRSTPLSAKQIRNIILNFKKSL